MGHLVWLAISILFSSLATGSDDGSYEVAIVLQSNSSEASGLDVSGKVVEIPIEDVSVTLYATLLVNLTGFAQVRLDWYKNGMPVNVSLPRLRRLFCDGLPGNFMYTLNCTHGLPLSAIKDGVAGNYSLKYFPYNGYPVMMTWVKVITDRARRLEFTSVADPVVNCSPTNATVLLSYLASGFPRPTYSLNCSGQEYYFSPAESTGVFVLPPGLCYSNLTCQAVARNDYHSMILSPVTVIVALSRPSHQPPTPTAIGHEFLLHPPDVVNADKPAANGMMVLQYAVAGAVAYTLHCNSTTIQVGTRANFSSASVNFTVPPLACGVNTTCHAVASFIDDDDVISPDTMLLASACRPTATSPMLEGPPNIPLTVSLVASVTVILALVAAIVSCCQRRRVCLLHQLKVGIEAKQVDATGTDVDRPVLANCPKKTEEVCSDFSTSIVYPNDVTKATRQELLYGQTLTCSYPLGMPCFSQLHLPNLSGDRPHCLEMDCGDRSATEPRQPYCSGARITSERGVSAEPVSSPLERYPSPTSPSTVIVIGASHVQLGNGNTMVCSGCNSGLDNLNISLPDCPSEPTPEAEHICLSGSWLPADGCGSPEIHSAATTDCLSPEVSIDQYKESSLPLSFTLA